MAEPHDSGTNAWQVVLDHPIATSIIVGSIAFVVVVLMLRGPLSRAIDSLARRGGKLPGGIELNAEVVAQAGAPQATAQSPTLDTLTQALLGPVIEERVRELDANLRKTHKEDEQRRTLLVLAVRERINAEFERVYRIIYGSQITAVKGANTAGTLSRAALESTYNSAVSRDTAFYEQISFEQWVNFLLAQLLLRQDGDRFQITNRGQLFLHFMVEQGLSDYGLPHNAQR
jgi:hypothetical protein